MIQISNLSIHFAGKYLFDNVTLVIRPDDKIGLIGRNGSGKSTLLKIINGLQQAEEGTVSIPNHFKIGYLPQEGRSESTKSVFEETYNSLTEIKELKAGIQFLENEITTRKDYETKEYLRLIQDLSEANEKFEILGGASVEAQIEQILTGLGFSRNEFRRPMNEFSGGWQMRVELAKILLQKPDCILLDEPTNHLDIESIQWLETFLKTYKGIVVLVSHDRNFLDAVTIRTIEISLGKIYDFNLPYTQFITHRIEIKKQHQNAFDNQQRQIAQTERFIERFRYKATLSSRVQSRVKMLEKMDRIEVEDDDKSSIKFRFPPAPRSGRIVAECSHLTKKYDSKIVLDDINFAMEMGEKIAFVGKNGEGKTTLSRIIANDIADFDGHLKIGTNVLLGYYAQHQAELLDANSTVFDIIDRVATGDMRSRIRSLLGAFLFSGDSVYKKVKVLSGGEKSRLAIARLLLKETNLLILDEPTNHLDMTAKDVLKNALLNYSGSLILVSHDRNFLHGLTSRTVYFADKNIKEYPGDIYDFIETHKLESLHELNITDRSDKLNKVILSQPKDETKQSQNQIERNERKRLQREENKINKQISSIENLIEELEAKMKILEDFFSNPENSSNVDLLLSKQKEYNELKAELPNMLQEWTKLHTELEELS
ncbi:MAG: ABC-F family ATP-binding cassette domain-containing protein [bacterium]